MTTLKTNQLKFVNYNVRIVRCLCGPSNGSTKDSIIMYQIMRAIKKARRYFISPFILMVDDENPRTHTDLESDVCLRINLLFASSSVCAPQ